jgi:hypothetical protein
LTVIIATFRGDVHARKPFMGRMATHPEDWGVPVKWLTGEELLMFA